MALSRERMLDRMLASDASYDGRFVTGVLTTGIYCLPSCRARKPKPENVRFFPGPEAAEAAGLRPCKRCRPDRYYRGVDPDRERIEGLVGQLRASPERYADARQLAAAAGVGASKLNELCRRHFHASPAELLTAARVEGVRRELLAGDRRVSDLAFAAGFESLSAFHAAFRARLRLAPGAYRRLAGAEAFAVELPRWFERRFLLRYLGRDPASLTERLAGRTFTFGTHLDGRPAAVTVELGSGLASCRLDVTGGATAAAGPEAHGRVLRTLGLHTDPLPFERRVAALDGLARLTAGRRGLTIPQTRDPFDGLVWVIAGQQISLKVAVGLRRRLAERAGTPLAEGLWAPPTPAAVAALEPAELGRLGFSARKAEYLSGVARRVAAGALDLERLATASASTIEECLLAERGLGPWSTHYLMMRAFGLADCVPLGDAGLLRALRRFFALEERPGRRRTLELLRPFAPYRSLATFHLWATLEDDR